MTTHNKANENDYAKVVLMSGDPLRAKYIAENFLEDAKLINDVRGMLAYTGKYKGKEISVMGHGMGIPSMGIYAHELYEYYNVETIIRMGSCGGYIDELNLNDLIVVDEIYSESTFGERYTGSKDHFVKINNSCNDLILNKAKEMRLEIKHGNVHCSDTFYTIVPTDIQKLNEEHGCLAVEMESYALYCNAAFLGKEALTILTVSDSFVSDDITTAEERQKTFTAMMEIALDLI